MSNSNIESNIENVESNNENIESNNEETEEENVEVINSEENNNELKQEGIEEIESDEEEVNNDNNSNEEVETDWNEEFGVNKKNFKENSSKFKFHPEIEDPDFYKKIYSKKEFYKHQYKDENRKMEEICPQTSKSREFKLMPHQEFLKNYISPNTPYNGVLIYHSTGVGKTCTAISIAEGFKETLKYYGKKIIVISSEAIKKNFKKELYDPRKEKMKKRKDDIVQCTGLTYELGDEFKYLTPEQKLLKIDKIINESYQFYAYTKFANTLITNVGLDENNLKSVTEEQKRKINQIYSNRVIIVDEVHNIRKGGSKKEYKKIYRMLELIIENTTNLKLVLMSATPMYDKPKEIIHLLNLLLANDNRQTIKEIDIFDSEGNLKPEGEEKLLFISKGYVSYLRGENPSTFPLKLVPKEAEIPNIKYDILGEEIEKRNRIRYDKLILCDMKGVQYETYQGYIKKRLEDKKKELEKEENSKNNEEDKSRKIDNILGDKIIQISNIVYPTDTGEATYGKYGFDDKCEGPFNRVNVTQMDKTYTQFKYRKQAILNRGTKQEVPFLDEKVLGDYSAKFARALSFMKKAKGTVLLSSKYIQSGVLPFALMLEQNGFTRYTTEGEKQLLDQKDYPQTRRPRICYKCGEEFKKDQHINKKNKDYHLFKEARYVLVTSKSDNLVKININEAVDKFSATDNRYGEQIKIFLGTDVIKEGLDFANIRQMFILDPWYNHSYHNQMIGRAIRFCSHVRLHEEERNVEVFKMALSNSDSNDEKIRETETADENRYRIAEMKDYRIKSVRNILKRSAIDCVPYKKRNLYGNKKKVKQVTSRGETIMISKDDKPFSAECDYKEDCLFKCVWEPSGKIKIDTDTYDLIFDKSDIDKIKKSINKLFKKDLVFDIKTIIEFVKKDYPEIEIRFIYKALEDLLKNEEFIEDKFRRKSKLIYAGDYYILEPVELAELKLPVLYREKPLTKKPRSFKYLDYKLSNIINDMVNENKNDNKEKSKQLINKYVLELIKNIKKYDYIKKKDTSSKKKSYEMAVIGTTIDKIDVKDFVKFVKHIFTFYIGEKKDEFLNKNKELIKTIMQYLDNIIIKNGREINEKEYKKDYLYGFYINDEYLHYSREKGKWDNCKVYIVRQIETYKKNLKNNLELKDKTTEKNNIIGILSKNKKNAVVFQIIDFDKYKYATTQKNKKSKRSELKGQVCKTIDADILLDLRKKLNIGETKQKKTRIFICDEIQILLRTYTYNNKDNKIWLINKNI